MSSIASFNAFKGYSFQNLVFTLFLIKMDYDRKILRLKAENFVDGHNFDDIYLETNDASVYIQVKNMEILKEQLKIKNNVIQLNNQKILYYPENINLLIIKDINITSNCFFMGLPCYKQENLYICSLNPNAIFDLIENLNIDEKRLWQLMMASSSVSAQKCEITIEDLPSFNFYNTELQEETLAIRKEILDCEKNAVNFIVGKPGIGKSHLAKELSIKNSILYRFWIGENDINKSERLQYCNFIKDISFQIFNCSHIKEENEIIEKLNEDKKILIIDGLDHVENYNCNEIDKFFAFIQELESKNVHSIILTRPLRHEILGNIIELSNWNKSQTKEFINKKYNIKDYSLEESIYNISKGYPIIVDFLCKEYLQNNEIRPFPDIQNLNTYFDTLISDNDIKNLYIFAKCKCFLIFEELEQILGQYNYDMFQEFLNRNKFLFNINGNRVALIHDSLNLYINTKLSRYPELDDKIQSFVVHSLSKNEIRFFTRFQSFELEKDETLIILKNYLNLDVFKKILYANLDYESIRNFYKILPYEMSKFSSNDFTELEYLQLSIIESIVARNHIEQNFQLLIPLFNYLNKHTPKTYNIDIYSSETLYTLQSFNLKEYERYIDEGFYDINQVMDSYIEAQNEYYLFLKRNDGVPVDTSKINFSYISSMGEYWGIQQITALICKLFLTNNNYLQSVDFVKLCANEKSEYYSIAYKILQTFNIETSQRNITNLKNNVRDLIFQYGKFEEVNYYTQKTLKELINEYAKKGSFTLNSCIASYLRYAIICDKTIDIESISLYWGMFYQRKDYSLDEIQTFLSILKNHKLIKLQDCCNLINTCQKMTEKSYRDNFNDFLNNLSFKELTKFLQTNDLKNYRINTSSLKPKIINALPKHFVYYEICEIILGYNPPKINSFVEFGDIHNILESKYKDWAITLIKDNNITIYYAPKELKIEGINIVHNKDEYVAGTQFENGYAYYMDKEYIAKKNISHLELSKMINGHYFRLPCASLFYHCKADVIKADIKKIFFNALCLNNTQYFYCYLYNMSISSIIELLDYFKIDVDWNEIKTILVTYLDLSLVI